MTTACTLILLAFATVAWPACVALLLVLRRWTRHNGGRRP